jgi:hypothetical protein
MSLPAQDYLRTQAACECSNESIGSASWHFGALLEGAPATSTTSETSPTSDAVIHLTLGVYDR